MGFPGTIRHRPHRAAIHAAAMAAAALLAGAARGDIV